MKLFTGKQLMLLIGNSMEYAACRKSGKPEPEFKPVVKLFCPWNGATWLLTELDPEDLDTAFGLCDLGMGEPEVGTVSLAEIRNVQGPAGLKIERDLHFKADKTLEQYADEARRLGRIRA